MADRHFDGNFFDFPLCSLIYCNGEKQRIDRIISYCIMEVLEKFRESNKKQHQFKLYQDVEKHLGITIGSKSDCLERHSKLKSFINTYEQKYGKDAYCRMGKSLTFEARDGQFGFLEYTVLCAIQSIIGKKAKFKRITYDKIRYRMHGYRSKDIFIKNGEHVKLLTDRQLKRLVDILHAKKFYSKYTYQRRQIYFSTKLDDEQLREAVLSSKVFWKKKKLALDDREHDQKIKEALKEVEEKFKQTKKPSNNGSNALRVVRGFNDGL